ncbi:hypothetical protein FJY90_07215 [Candidatus Gottesmanbacteria bacterium]|nr:hypothetical protein [Candidatus Poribacteria bacterium]MBM3283999.1 hypothetical protein [Candidatus Gottesmanbacteria bacterium]
MSGRKLIFANEEYYHIYNRGIARQPIFADKRDYERFFLTFSFYRFLLPPVKLSRLLQLPHDQREDILNAMNTKSKKLIDIISYAFMPNHFHLLLKQNIDNGISIFLSKSTNSYTRFFNLRHKRIGDLFQGVFKAVHIETDEQLIHLSRYIHLNPVASFIIKDSELISYPWSSLLNYLDGKSSILELKSVLSHFGSPKNYKRFVFDQIEYGKKLELVKHLTIE